jgi:hypothetical protein
VDVVTADVPRQVLGFASALAVSCQPLADPSEGTSIKRCPVPCPERCARDCLPSGFCSEVLVTAGEARLQPVEPGGNWFARAPGLPPNAATTFSIHAGLDVVERSGQVPAWENVSMVAGDSAIHFRGAYDSFPLWGDLGGLATSGPDGIIDLRVSSDSCELEQPSEKPRTCSIDPASTFRFTLVVTRPWLEAPPCE